MKLDKNSENLNQSREKHHSGIDFMVIPTNKKVKLCFTGDVYLSFVTEFSDARRYNLPSLSFFFSGVFSRRKFLHPDIFPLMLK